MEGPEEGYATGYDGSEALDSEKMAKSGGFAAMNLGLSASGVSADGNGCAEGAVDNNVVEVELLEGVMTNPSGELDYGDGEAGNVIDVDESANGVCPGFGFGASNVGDGRIDERGDSSDNHDAESDNAGSVVEVGGSEEDDADSVVEVGEREFRSSAFLLGERSAGHVHDKERVFAPLGVLVNNRMAEATMNLHIITGPILLRLCLLLAVICLASATFTFVGLRLARNAPILTTPQALDVFLFALTIRGISTIFSTFVCISYTFVVVKVLSNQSVTSASSTNNATGGAPEEEVEEDWRSKNGFTKKSRQRKKPQVIVLLMVWCAWLITPLNPIIWAVDLVAFVHAKEAQDGGVYLRYWPRARYSTIANALFVASQFYALIYLFKWLRLEGIKRERVLRRLLGPGIGNSHCNENGMGNTTCHTGQNSHDTTSEDLIMEGQAVGEFEERAYSEVRSLNGLIPRMAILYVVARLVLCESFFFDMGWVPGIAWISVVRFCATTESDLRCDEYPKNVITGLTVMFCVWEWFLMIWICVEAWRAKRVFRLFYLLQGRNTLVSFRTLGAALGVTMFTIYFTGIVSVSAIPLVFGYNDQSLSYTGVELVGQLLGLACAMYIGLVCYLFLPCCLSINPLRICCSRTSLVAEQSSGYVYFRSYSELSHGTAAEPLGHLRDGNISMSTTTFISSGNAFGSDNFRSGVLDAVCESKNGSDGDDNRSGVEMPKHAQPVDAFGLGMPKKSVVTTAPIDPTLDKTRRTTADLINRCIESSSALCFDTMVLLWNFSHIMYLTGNSKHSQSDSDVLLLVEDKRFELVEQVSDGALDTYAAVFASPEMVVVTFRGNGNKIWDDLSSFTASLNTMCRPVQLGDITEEGIEAEDEDSVLEQPGDEEKTGSPKFASLFNNAVGDMFVTDPPMVWTYLYQRCASCFPRIVALLEQLQALKQRPVFFTGHGAGGTFASMAAGAAAQVPALSDAKLGVYTFGAPRFCNLSYKKQYASRIQNHFDVANVGDALHDYHAMEAFLPDKIVGKLGYSLVRLGTAVLMDSLGNLVVNPDWLEVDLLRTSKRKQFQGHEPHAYTKAFMMWSHRLYGTDHRELWSSPLHEIKFVGKTVKALERKSWQTRVIKAYLETSKVGLGPYLGGACIQIKVMRITGLMAQRSTCIISSGPEGISSSFWEVEKTLKAVLHHRTLFNLVTSEDEERHGKSDDDDSDGDNDNDEGSMKNKKSNTKMNNNNKASNWKRKDQSGDSKGDKDGNMRTDRSKTGLLGLGVDADTLASVEARYADFSESPAMLFGTYQMLRPCASITIGAVDASYGNFGTITFPITKLFPLPTDEPKNVSFPLAGRARKPDSGELKVHLQVLNVGKQTLESLCSSQDSIDLPGVANGGDVFSSAYEQPLIPSQQQRQQPKVRLSPAMATFYLNRNFNPNSQRVVLRVGVIRAAMHTLDLQLKHGALASSIYCEARVGREWARTCGASNARAPEWNEMFTFGKVMTLTGFEEVKLEFYATWDCPTATSLESSIGSTSSPDSRINKHNRNGSNGRGVNSPVPLSRTKSVPRQFSARTSNSTNSQHSHSNSNTEQQTQLIGVVSLSFSAVITDFQDELLVQWVPLEPLRTNKDDETGDAKQLAAAPRDAQLPGQFCICFELCTEVLAEKLPKNSRTFSCSAGTVGGINGGNVSSGGVLGGLGIGTGGSTMPLYGGQLNSASSMPLIRHVSSNSTTLLGSGPMVNSLTNVGKFKNSPLGFETQDSLGSVSNSMLNSPQGGLRSSRGNGMGASQSGSGLARMPALVRNASGSLRNLMSPFRSADHKASSLNSPSVMGGEVGLNGLQPRKLDHSLTSQHSNDDNLNIMGQVIPEDWNGKMETMVDERKYVVRIFVNKAYNLEQVMPQLLAAGGSNDNPNIAAVTAVAATASNGPGPSSFGSDASSLGQPTIDPFCEVSLLDPLDGFSVTQTKKTAIVRDCASPIWEEEFVFGHDRDHPVRGNEVLSVALYHWELGMQNLKFGEFRVPVVRPGKPFKTKESYMEALEFYDADGEVISNVVGGPVADVQFAVMVSEFVNKHHVDKEQKQGALHIKSPML